MAYIRKIRKENLKYCVNVWVVRCETKNKSWTKEFPFMVPADMYATEMEKKYRAKVTIKPIGGDYEAARKREDLNHQLARSS